MTAPPFDIRPDVDGTWTVYDIATSLPALVKGALQTGLPLEDADDLADLLSIQAVRAMRTDGSA